MKKTIRVIIEKEIEIDIADERLTPEAIEEFESYMFTLDDFGKDKVKDLFYYVASQVFDEQATHVDGVGEAVQDYMKQFNSNAVILFNTVSEEREMEVV